MRTYYTGWTGRPRYEHMHMSCCGGPVTVTSYSADERHDSPNVCPWCGDKPAVVVSQREYTAMKEGK